MPAIIKAIKLGSGTPTFAVNPEDHRYMSVFGATKFKDDPLVYYPAYYPAYKMVLGDIQALRLNCTFSGTAQELITKLDTFEEKIKKRTLPQGFQFKTTPFQHQLDGLVHILYLHRAALFYACGLGKTKIIIDWQRATQCFPLILCPRVVLQVWPQEVLRHGINQKFRFIDGATKQEKLAQLAEVAQAAPGEVNGVVMTYDVARLYTKEVVSIPYNAFVADECHYIKSWRSDRTKAALDLASKAARRVIMSGTPTLGDPRDMYSQIRLLSPVYMPENIWEFKNKFCIPAKSNPRIIVGFKSLDVLQERVARVAIKRTKQECLDLPEQQIIDVYVRLHGDQRAVYNGLIEAKEYADLVDTLLKEPGLIASEGRLNIPNMGVLINKLLQVTGGFVYQAEEKEKICDDCEQLSTCVETGVRPYTAACRVDSVPRKALVSHLQENAKLDMLLQKLDEILVDPDNKVIIWGQFHPELNLIQKAITELWSGTQWTLVRVDGKSHNSAAAEQEFNNNPNCRVYLGQVATGVGITLNAANYMVYYSLPWKFGDYEQSKDRNHRIGQRRQSTIFRLIAADTVDVSVLWALRNKRSIAEVLTTAMLCSSCLRQGHCAENAVEVFSSECKYTRTINRRVTRVKELKYEESVDPVASDASPTPVPVKKGIEA